MSLRYKAGINLPGYDPIKVPNAPTIGTVIGGGNGCVSVAFTAPSCVGGSAITSYTVTANCGIKSASGTSSPLTVTGLTIGSSYTFNVVANNAYGPSYPSASSNSVVPPQPGSQSYTTAGTYTWIAPSNVTSVSVVAVGGGGGNRNTVAAGDSYFINTTTVKGGKGGGGTDAASLGGGGPRGTYTGDGGGCGGQGIYGGGGAGGYSGAGGNGGQSGTPNYTGGNGSGGGGGGGGWGGGGGVGIFGQGANGVGGVTCTAATGGSGGGAPSLYNAASGSNFGGLYGGGATGWGGSGGGGGGGGLGYKNNISVTPGSSYTVVVGRAGSGSYGAGGNGAVRIVWPGTTRQFPSTNVGTP